MLFRSSQLIVLLMFSSLTLAGDLTEMNQAERNQELRWAASSDDAETIEQLLDAGASVSAANKFCKTSLMNAA